VNAKRKFFGTDGIRGVANQYPMTAEVALDLGRAIAYRLRGPASHRTKVLIGKDTRLSGYMLEQALASGLTSAGADVMLCGPLPTPAVAYLTWSMRADAGVVISASHNPFQDNGLKIFGSDGFKLDDDVELELEALLGSDELHDFRPTATRIGRAHRVEDAKGRYAVFAKGAYPKDLTLEGVKIAVDCAHGAAYKVGPEALHELGAEVVSLGCKPNGTNINKKSGALHPDSVARHVKKVGADVGVALDGDADRCILVDERGEQVDGDRVMALVGRRLLAEGRLQRNTVVATVMSNIGLEESMRAVGGDVVRTQVGDRYVVERMRAEGYSFGGEQSGHIINLEHSTTGDGLVTALTVLGIMVREGRPLSELADCMTLYPQKLHNLKVARKVPLDELPSVQKVIAAVEERLGDSGRVLVRYSGTEMKARVLVEGDDPAALDVAAEEIGAALERALSA
jgi:phosphoglucosamine mutase